MRESYLRGRIRPNPSAERAIALPENRCDTPHMSVRGRLAIFSLLVATAAVSFFSLLANRASDESHVLMCPGSHSSRVFTDARMLCASEATALARIDWDGRLAYLVDPDMIPCRIPEFEVINENTTRIGGPERHCDTDTAGTSLYLFPRCSLTMNYPGNEDYRAALPIGLLVEPNGC
jgi:hypothetical protein